TRHRSDEAGSRSSASTSSAPRRSSSPERVPPGMSDDQTIITQIEALVDEEHRLRAEGNVDTTRLDHVEEMLDQCWDLLRQRGGRRGCGGDRGGGSARPVETVENYEQ